MEPLRGTNKATWCVKLLPTTVSAYQVDCGCFCALLRTHCCCVSTCGWYNPPSASHPPPTLTPPPINSICDITAVGKNHLKNQQCQLGGRISYETIATKISGQLTYTASLAWLHCSTGEPQWLQYFKLVFLEIQNVPLRTVFANPVTYIDIGSRYSMHF